MKLPKTQSENAALKKPAWLRVKPFSGKTFEGTRQSIAKYGLNTVCREANCPNRGECFNKGTATFLIMGPLCTRGCRFCDIGTGKPGPLNPQEPANVAAAAKEMGLKFVVVTSVTRDDLPDGGSAHFAQTVQEIRKALPQAGVEVLTPDFRGKTDQIDTVIQSRPDVFNHNVETVPRLYSKVRPSAIYPRSLELLKHVDESSGIVTKSGLMVGVGETEAELRTVFYDLARIGVSVLTIGQYLAPSASHLPVVRYVTPEEFDTFKKVAQQAGIPRVLSGPLVRSSYDAHSMARPSE
jgi:lipoic acid synthetase